MANDIFRIGDGEEITDHLLMKYISENDALTTSRYDVLWRAYNNDYDILHARAKPTWKPDNRLLVNYARYIVETFVGFSYGIPVKVIAPDDETQDYIDVLNDATDADGVIMKLATAAAIFGRAYRIAYVTEAGSIGTAVLDPREAFAIYDEAITPTMRYFVRTYIGVDKKRHGSISDDYSVRYFHVDGSIVWDEEYPHGFGRVPACECIMGENRRGIYEDVLSLINAYNKTLSEKADDVEYFSDAYLKVLGAALDEETIRFMRENRVVNLVGKAAADVVVDFIARPSADETQEHMLDRLERLIFTVSMVCNINDDHFATSSGIALKYKMLPMINLAGSAWSEMSQSLNEYYRLVCASPVTPIGEDVWSAFRYVHVLNYPTNLLDEANAASILTGIVSRRTQLSTLSIVDSVDDEMQRLESEAEQEAAYVTPYAAERVQATTDEELDAV